MKNEISEKICIAMKNFRIKNKIMANTVAEDLGMTKGNFSRMEAGKNDILVSTLVNWSKIIGCSPEYAIQVYTDSLKDIKIRSKKAKI